MTTVTTSEQRHAGNLRRVAIEGAMTVYEAVERKRELLAAVAEAGRLEIDLSGVAEMDSAGLQLLVLALREALAAGKPALLVGRSAACQEVLDSYGLGPDFGGEPLARQE